MKTCFFFSNCSSDCHGGKCLYCMEVINSFLFGIPSGSTVERVFVHSIVSLRTINLAKTVMELHCSNNRYAQNQMKPLSDLHMHYRLTLLITIWQLGTLFFFLSIQFYFNWYRTCGSTFQFYFWDLPMDLKVKKEAHMWLRLGSHFESYFYNLGRAQKICFCFEMFIWYTTSKAQITLKGEPCAGIYLAPHAAVLHVGAFPVSYTHLTLPTKRIV